MEDIIGIMLNEDLVIFRVERVIIESKSMKKIDI
jgi:hypothetical protein